MKLIGRLIPVLVILLFFCSNAFAAAEKIGVVDMEKFREQSVSFQKTFSTIKKKADAMQAKLDKERDALRKLEEDFQKQKLMLNLDAQEDKQLALEKKKRYVKYLYEDFSFEMKAAEMDTQKRIGNVLNKIVKKIGEKEGYSVIIEKRALGLIYYSPAIDITSKVVQIYDRENP